MAIEKIVDRDPHARDKMNAAITKANLVDSKASLADLRSLPSPLPVQHRPGDALLDFGLSLADGEAGGIPPLPEAFLRYDENGRVVRLIGANIVAPRHLYALEPNRRYLVTFAVQRRIDSADPSNDAVRCALAWYGQGKGRLSSPAQTVAQDLAALTTGSGRTVVRVTVARAAGDGIDIVAPASARYCRPYVQAYGTQVQSDVEVINWVDITDATTFAPDVMAVEDRVSALESLDLGDRLTVIESQVTAPNAFRVETIGALAAAMVPIVCNLVEVLGYYDAGDGGGHQRVRAMSATDTTVQDVSGAYWDIAGTVADVRMFGARGDAADAPGTGTDDATAVQKAMAWLATPGSSVLTFGHGRYRLSSGCAIDLDEKQDPASILMDGSIKPDPGIGAALTISNARGGRYDLQVLGGGQLADYTQPDPDGCDEAFRFVNLYGSHIENVTGADYRGRVLRITGGPVGASGHPSQLLTIDRIHVDSAAAITDSEPERMARGVGQSFYIDTNMSGFGTVRQVFAFFETYGPVVEDTYDITIDDIETLFRGLSGMEARGVISFWGGVFKLGSELEVSPPTLLKILPSGVQNSQQVSIDTLFCVGGDKGLYAEDVGDTVGQGLAIRSINTRVNQSDGVHLHNCEKFSLGQLQGWRDRTSLRLSGACQSGKVDIDVTETKRQGMVIEAGVLGEIYFTGTVQNGNTDVAADTSLIDIETVGTIYFNDLYASSDHVDYLYDLPVGNTVRIAGGRVNAVGDAEIHSTQPERCEDVRGWITENRGLAIIPSGQTSVVVTHALTRAPDFVQLTLRGSPGPSIYWSSPTDTHFTISAASAVGTDTGVDWRAWLNYAG